MDKLKQLIKEVLSEKKVKRDRCLRIADRKFDKPSAYKSGAVVRCRQGKIWKGIKEDKQLGEAKQVGTIYHYTTFDNGLEILQSNQLKGFETEGHTNTNPIYGLSFTRDKRFHNNHNIGFDASVFGQKPQVRFTIDGDKLSNKYKIQPYAQIGGSGRFEKGQEEFESEERVIFNKPFSIPLLPYLKSIDILIEYKKPKYDDDIDDDNYNYRKYTPLRAKTIKFAQDNNIPINLIINKNGDPYPDKIKQTLIQKILKYFQTNEDESLHKWFKRSGPKGKEGGWVDCNAPDGKGGYKACGRKEGEKRSKYPACRPTPAGCKKKGKGKTWGKTK